MGSWDDELGGADTFQHTVEPVTLKHDVLIGKLLGGRYLVVRLLGEGGFGAVYLATDEKMSSRKVVIKVLHKQEMSNEWSVKRFEQEIEALTRIEHPAIVGIYDAGEMDDGSPFIVMQYVEGLNLRAVIESGQMDMLRIANIIRQIGRALTAAHARGILHRDLKPENIMLHTLSDGEEQVKIIDFGIAKVRDSKTALKTAPDQAVGTVAYMAPEQLRAESPTFACDVYSMAIIAYEMLTGQRPLNPTSTYQLLELQREGVSVKPSHLRVEVPPLADQAVLRALAFNPDARYESARQFAESLADALSGVSEETLIASQNAKQLVTPVEEPKTEAPVTASVLFMDIVGYSKLLMDQQTSSLRRLQETVLNSAECRNAYDANKCLRLPTGDGMALVFFTEPEMAVRAALEITETLKSYPEIPLRMGIHTGLVYRMADINTNLNVAGGGINMAQRVMDCGDTGHILVSKRVADDLRQLSSWVAYLHELGEAKVKHGVPLDIFNLYGEGFGNPEIPSRLANPKPEWKYTAWAAAIGAVLILGVIVGAWYFTSSRTGDLAEGIRTDEGQKQSTSPLTAGAEQLIIYWLDVQKPVGKGFGPVFQSTGSEVFGNGWRFKFNIQPAQSGALYLLNEGPGQHGETVYDVLFPTPRQGGMAELQAQQVWQTGWNVFQEGTGVEKLWIVWSPQTLSDLDLVFAAAFKTGGRVSSNEVEKLRKYLALYQTAPPKVVPLKEKEQTVVSGSGETLVSRVELSHKSY